MFKFRLPVCVTYRRHSKNHTIDAIRKTISKQFPISHSISKEEKNKEFDSVSPPPPSLYFVGKQNTLRICHVQSTKRKKNE